MNVTTFVAPARLLRSPVCSGIGLRGWLAVLGVLCLLGVPDLAAAGPASASQPQQQPLEICPKQESDPNQEYALCATAQCFYLNGVAYCKCNLKQGKSISISFEFDNGQDVCSLLDDGVSNGYTVSTFSLPDQVTKEYAAAYNPSTGEPPPLALYTCPKGGQSTGPYAQCDGGACFDSTTGASFPGVGPIGPDQILCSCPVTDPRTTKPALGYQIAGPWQHSDGSGACGANDSPADCCSANYFTQFCSANYRVIPTGTTIPVGAPTGAAQALAILLGDHRAINRCFDQ